MHQRLALAGVALMILSSSAGVSPQRRKSPRMPYGPWKPHMAATVRGSPRACL